jgi:D-tagatose-1,6-bisphosphate aldolase subunit GatZ/KbaZ
MSNLNILENIAKENKKKKKGIVSICSSNEYVLEAALERALKLNEIVLIEATANQVNQFGGYTGMKPADFIRFVDKIANRIGFPLNKLIVGGDHLGPLIWQDKDSDEAMELATNLVKQFVNAGFAKIHIDTSMMLANDKKDEFNDRIIAERSAYLINACEQVFSELNSSHYDRIRPVYIIGSEVPTPGGIQNKDEKVSITSAKDLEYSIQTFQEIFYNHGLSSAWERVIAVVAQLGVEFGDDTIHEYDHNQVKYLSSALINYPNLCFEGHSTDYQKKEALRQMVEDGVAILKVGPALTFALREGIFALSMIEKEISSYSSSIVPSNFIEVLDHAMLQYPDFWKKHYYGTPEQIAYKRKYSYSDRCRYYFSYPEVRKALEKLICNLRSIRPPLSLISQFMPQQYKLIRSGELENEPEALMKSKITECLNEYGYAAYAEDS